MTSLELTCKLIELQILFLKLVGISFQPCICSPCAGKNDMLPFEVKTTQWVLSKERVLLTCKWNCFLE